MQTKWLQLAAIIFLRSKVVTATNATIPDIELEHDPYRYRPPSTTYIDNTIYEVPGAILTPDYREEEPPFYAQSVKFYNEENRPYRMSPHHIQQYRWGFFNDKDNPQLMGCYCTTVFERLTPLAGCAVLTTRHILTTASSTELIVKTRRNKNLENILGAWYDIDANVWNSSMYMTPARIHYHPEFIRTEQLNVSHPLCGYFDLALWAATFPLYGSFKSESKACICNRAGSRWPPYSSSTPRGELLYIVGFQFIMAWKKKPMPWFKYAVRTRETVNPCPKTEWGWYHCVPANWAVYGIEPGAALHRNFGGVSWRFDGLIGLNMFSMRLRSEALIHYFHTLDTHPVLDFLYSAYNGRLPYDHLDERFYNTQWHSPYPKPGHWIPWKYTFGEVPRYKKIPFNY